MSERKAEQLYRSFMGREVDGEMVIDLEDMDSLAFLGAAIAIEYQAQKHADRKAHIYRHEFENPAMVLTNGRQIVIFGDSIKVTRRGIEG